MNGAARSPAGFTFLEMALVLFSLGFVLSAAPRLANQGAQAMQSSPLAKPEDATERALTGYVLANNRLPCPASATLSVMDANYGKEDCTLSRGIVPHKTLRLAAAVMNADGLPLAYAIYRDAANNNDLAVGSSKFTPTYQFTSPIINYANSPGTQNSDQTNGLDFCAKLRNAAMQPASESLLGTRDYQYPLQGVNVAWVLVDPGKANADFKGSGNDGFFDGYNSLTGSGWFESPSKALGPAYDDKVRSTGLTQLFSELHCPSTLSAVSAAAREVDYANDHLRVRSFLADFRSYELRVREQKKTQADNMYLLALFDISITVASSVLDLGIALAGPSGAGGIAVSVINMVASIALSAYNFSNASDSKDSAAREVTEGNARVTQANAARDAANTFRTERIDALQLLDQRGWFQ